MRFNLSAAPALYSLMIAAAKNGLDLRTCISLCSGYAAQAWFAAWRRNTPTSTLANRRLKCLRFKLECAYSTTLMPTNMGPTSVSRFLPHIEWRIPKDFSKSAPEESKFHTNMTEFAGIFDPRG